MEGMSECVCVERGGKQVGGDADRTENRKREREREGRECVGAHTLLLEVVYTCVRACVCIVITNMCLQGYMDCKECSMLRVHVYTFHVLNDAANTYIAVLQSDLHKGLHV